MKITSREKIKEYENSKLESIKLDILDKVSDIDK